MRPRRPPRYAGPERRADRTRWLRAAFTVWAILLSTIVIWTAQQSRHRAAEGRQAHDALCVFKQDLQRRAAAGAAFLQQHPNGLPAAGITRAVLTASLAGQVSTIRSLDRLRCDPSTPPAVTVPVTVPSVPSTNP